jgi:hypothetical protein
MTRRHRFSFLARAVERVAFAVLVVMSALVAGAAPALAHHGWSGYDNTTLLTLSGTIVDVQYENPHVMVTLAVPQEEEEAHAEGEVHEDAEIVDPSTVIVVMAPPSRSESRGLAREMLVPGAVATFEGYLHKSVAMELRAERITLGDLTVELR